MSIIRRQQRILIITLSASASSGLMLLATWSFISVITIIIASQSSRNKHLWDAYRGRGVLSTARQADKQRLLRRHFGDSECCRSRYIASYSGDAKTMSQSDANTVLPSRLMYFTYNGRTQHEIKAKQLFQFWFTLNFSSCASKKNGKTCVSVIKTTKFQLKARPIFYLHTNFNPPLHLRSCGI